MDLLTRYSSLVGGFAEREVAASSSDILLTLGKISFGNSCKNSSLIQQSDLELWTFWAGSLVWLVVWPNKMLVPSSTNFIAMPRKRISGNSWKNLRTIQRSDQELWTSWAGTLVSSVVWPDQTPSTSHAISLRRQGNKTIETPVKI
jgi:hypothetical protein